MSPRSRAPSVWSGSQPSAVRASSATLLWWAWASSPPRNYSPGDVANHYHPVFKRHIRVEHWQNALKQGPAAARNMLGENEPYDEIPWFWSDQYEHNLQYAGFHTEWDELVIRGSMEERNFVAFYRKDGRVLAAVAINRARDLRRSIPLIKNKEQIVAAELCDLDIDLRTLAGMQEIHR